MQSIQPDTPTTTIEDPPAYQQIIRDTLQHNEHFTKATFSIPANKQQTPWTKVTVRPILLRDKKHLQISYFDAKKDISKNYTVEELPSQVDILLSFNFKHIHLHTKDQTTRIQITKKGRVLIHTSRPVLEHQESNLAHDRQKKTFLTESAAAPFLQAVGLMGDHGKIKADMYSKFRQIQEFIKLITQTGALDQLTSSPLHIIDAGCGNAYLTFAFYYYLHDYLKKPTNLIGIDSRNEPLERHRQKTAQLNWSNLTFQACTIIDFQPTNAPDIVLSLHACDTATDEAIAQAIRWHSRLLVSVPCCHHHLQVQIEQHPAPASFAPILRHSILKERLGDILTDCFRVLILQIMGYQTDIVQFVSSEHTAKNLMIRSLQAHQPGNPQYIQEYKELKALWNVTPYLEELLGDDFKELV